jgi:hypothetical protein
LNEFLKLNFREPNVINAFGKFFGRRQLAFLILALGFPAVAFAEDNFHAGPLYDQFPLTLDSGWRTEAVGPLFYDQQKDSEKTWAFPPFFSRTTDPDVEYREDDFLYPLFTYESYGQEYRWQFFQLWSHAGGQIPQDDHHEKRFTIFPFYFQQRSPDTNENYTALLPFYGHLQHRLFRDKIFFVMLPIYVQSQKKDVITDNYLYPFFHVRRGDGLFGWQFWPVVGDEHKDVTTKTNGFGDTSIVGGYDKFFTLWPFFFKNNTDIGTEDPENFLAIFPLYLQTRSPKRDSTTALWPFFSWIDEREKKYREWQGPWPFVIFARGEGKTTSRVWPLFSQSHNSELESDSYLWPLYQFHRTHSDPLDLKRTRIMFYLFENTLEKNTETGADKRRVDAWPFFTYHRDFKGNNRLQLLALLEPVLPENDRIERNWSPLWSIWVSENNPKSGASSQSFLWNLFRHESTPTSKKCSLLFGLFQYQSDTDMKRLRLFYLPVFKAHPKTGKLAEL